MPIKRISDDACVTEAGDHLEIIQNINAPDDGGLCDGCGKPQVRLRSHVVVWNGRRPLCRACSDASPLGARAIEREAKWRAFLRAAYAECTAEGERIRAEEEAAYTLTRRGSLRFARVGPA